MMVLLLSCFSLSPFLCERTLQTNPNPGGSKMQLLRYLSRISVALPGLVSIGDLRLSTALTPNVWLLRGHLREFGERESAGPGKKGGGGGEGWERQRKKSGQKSKRARKKQVIPVTPYDSIP
ncbi:hypothetical protein GE21DRAFT_1051864 [Neurospora crassa]|nr:hypothetical protein GE21DRAFT_1051864 [Neurospora crassa]